MISLALAVLLIAAAPDVDARLQGARQLATAQETAAAVDAYRALLDDGVDGAALRYNLGTLLLEQGAVGEAVAHLRAARRLDPRDADVAYNLAIAREAGADKLAGDTDAISASSIGERIPPLAVRVALGVLLALCGVSFAAYGLTDVKRATLRGLAGGCCAAAIAAGAFWWCRVSFERTREAVVIGAETSAKKDADAGAAESFVAHDGLLGVVIEEQNGFVRLRLGNGLEAWFERSTLQFVDVER